jgi:hypothetical protein
LRFWEPHAGLAICLVNGGLFTRSPGSACPLVVHFSRRNTIAARQPRARPPGRSERRPPGVRPRSSTAPDAGRSGWAPQPVGGALRTSSAGCGGQGHRRPSNAGKPPEKELTESTSRTTVPRWKAGGARRGGQMANPESQLFDVADAQRYASGIGDCRPWQTETCVE